MRTVRKIQVGSAPRPAPASGVSPLLAAAAIALAGSFVFPSLASEGGVPAQDGRGAQVVCPE